jgi:hypothetical protein
MLAGHSPSLRRATTPETDHSAMRGLAWCLDCTENSWLQGGQEHREAQRDGDKRGETQDVFHVSSTHFLLASR